jgi:hypothetical protein
LAQDENAEVQIVWYLREPDDEVVSIFFGDEQVTPESYNVESLAQLRDVAAIRSRIAVPLSRRVLFGAESRFQGVCGLVRRSWASSATTRSGSV